MIVNLPDSVLKKKLIIFFYLLQLEHRNPSIDIQTIYFLLEAKRGISFYDDYHIKNKNNMKRYYRTGYPI